MITRRKSQLDAIRHRSSGGYLARIHRKDKISKSQVDRASPWEPRRVGYGDHHHDALGSYLPRPELDTQAVAESVLIPDTDPSGSRYDGTLCTAQRKSERRPYLFPTRQHMRQTSE